MSDLLSPSELQRVAVIGTSGSGKTTLAGSLAALLDVPHIELDALHWRPNWIPAPREDFRAAVAEAVARERWVLDGNYGAVRDIVWPRATHLIWLNYSFPLVAARVLRRTVRRIARREQLFGENRESFQKSFLSRDSILWWVVTTYHRRRRQYPLLFQQPENRHLTVTVFHSPRETDQFVAEMRQRLEAGAGS